MTAQNLTSSPNFSKFAAVLDPMNGTTGPQIATRLAAGDMVSYFSLLPNPAPVLRAMGENIRVYRNLLADPLVMGIRRRRMSAVLAMERGLHPDKARETPDKVLQACNDMLSRLDMQRIVRNLMDGAFFGYRVSEVMWGQGPSGVTPTDLIAKPCQWFGFEPENSELRFKPSGSVTGVAVPERKFIVVGKRCSWDNPYGEPDLAACFWPVTFKRAGFKFWMTFAEKYGMPWAVGTLPRGAPQSEVNDLADKLDAMVRDAVAVIPDDGSVTLMSVNGHTNSQSGSGSGKSQGRSSGELYERMLKFCRSEISIALLGSNQSVEAETNLASAQAAHKVEAWQRDDDAQMVASGFNQLVRMFCDVNFPGVVPPVFGFWEQSDINIHKVGRDVVLSKAGTNFTTEYWMRTYDLKDGDIRCA